jgi:hypothetical protein
MIFIHTLHKCTHVFDDVGTEFGNDILIRKLAIWITLSIQNSVRGENKR